MFQFILRSMNRVARITFHTDLVQSPKLISVLLLLRAIIFYTKNTNLMKKYTKKYNICTDIYKPKSKLYNHNI